jgi:hypothetical protein
MTKRQLVKLIHSLVEAEAMQSVAVSFKPVVRGHARLNARTITLPDWIMDLCDEFRIYYAVHEFTHFYIWDNFDKSSGRHCKRFLAAESKRLFEQFGIVVEYKKVFVKKLIREGKLVYG